MPWYDRDEYDARRQAREDARWRSFPDDRAESDARWNRDSSGGAYMEEWNRAKEEQRYEDRRREEREAEERAEARRARERREERAREEETYWEEMQAQEEAAACPDCGECGDFSCPDNPETGAGRDAAADRAAKEDR